MYFILKLINDDLDIEIMATGISGLHGENWLCKKKKH